MHKTGLLLLCSLLAASAGVADDRSKLLETGNVSAVRLAGNEDPAARRVFIVQLRKPSAAEHHASLVRALTLQSGSTSTAGKLNRENPVVQAYAQELAVEQQQVLASIGPRAEQLYSFQYGLNGFAAHMTASDAQKLAARDDVLQVWEDEIRPLTTTYSRNFLGLFDNEDGLRGTAGLNGEDIVIGVIDSGITPEHGALRDKRKSDRPRTCRSTWARRSLLGQWLCRRFSRLPDVLTFEAPENWNGTCQTGERFSATSCNNKLIGARYFVAGAQASGAIDEDEFLSPRDADGHGTHTATTAAGNRVKASLFGTFIGSVEGMAPRARIAVYKACWLRPDDTRAQCNTSDLANAIDAAVADGVDIINYSVGSSLRTAVAPDDVALLAATKAGVLAVVAAGNDGPNLGTIGSPAGAPWTMTVGASTREGKHSLEAIQIESPSNVAGKYEVREAAFTPPLRNRDPLQGLLVLVDDDDETLEDGSEGTTSDGCETYVNSSDVTGNVAFIERGGCTFETKIENAEEAGAIAALVFNVAGAPIVMTGTPDSVDIPALMIGQADGTLLRDEIDDEQTIEIVLDKGFFLTENDTGNVMGVFSSRGPGPALDILKPDVTAPGINILAGNSPDTANSIPDEKFAFRTGTSMSTPHVAGVAALLKQAHPEWSPAALKSALMTSARQNIDQDDGVTPAIPFDFGSGHIRPNKANDPGLVYDIRADEYDAFACGISSPAVEQSRCDALIAAGLSLQGPDLNQPSVSVGQLTATRTVTRRVRNPGDETATFVANIVPPPGIEVIVDPPSLSVGPGMSAEFDVTLNYLSGPMNLWRFGSLDWSNDEHDVHSVIALRPVSVAAPEEVESFGGTGSFTFPVSFGYNGNYQPGVHGLRSAAVFSRDVEEDVNKAFTFRSNNGVSMHLLRVLPDQAYVRFALFDQFTDGDDDLDMYVYYSSNGVDFSQVGKSGSPTSEEEVSFILPPAGTYAVLIHGFRTDNETGGAGARYDLYAWEFGLFDDPGNMTASGPGIVAAGNTEDITIDWSNLAAERIYLGAVSHNTPDGLESFTIVQIKN